MATATLLPNGKQQFIDINGVPLVGGFVYFYIPATNTPKATWQDAGEMTLNTNPVVLDSRGQAIIYGSGQYRQVVNDINGNLVWDQLTQDIYSLVQGAQGAQLNVAQTWTAAQRGGVSALLDGATITPDFSLANNFSVTLGGNRVLGNPTNIVAGQPGQIVVTQDGTGARTLSYGSDFKFAGGTAPTLTTTASAVDILSYYVESATRITITSVLNSK